MVSERIPRLRKPGLKLSLVCAKSTVSGATLNFHWKNRALNPAHCLESWSEMSGLEIAARSSGTRELPSTNVLGSCS